MRSYSEIFDFPDDTRCVKCIFLSSVLHSTPYCLDFSPFDVPLFALLHELVQIIMTSIHFQKLSAQEEANAVLRTESSAQQALRKIDGSLYLISDAWFSEWLKYVRHRYDEHLKKIIPCSQGATEDGEWIRPGPIDNTMLLAKDPVSGDLDRSELATIAPLRADLREKKDFWVVCEKTWNLLVGWYGCLEGGVVSRPYIPVGAAQRLEADPYCK